MTLPVHPPLEAGRVYRTRDLARWTAHAPRLAKRLMAEGHLVPLAHGLFAAPEQSRFGAVPPTEEALMRAFLDDAPFVFTGPPRWNALGLGTTAVFADTLVYNTKRTGRFVLDGRPFLLRRVGFPYPPPREWFAVDLLEHADQAASSRAELAPRLADAVARGRFDRDKLTEMALRYGSRETATLVKRALAKQAA
ncbi:MAG: hypothetical protein RLZZ450_6646 [Pseudomonadota bacterium]